MVEKGLITPFEELWGNIGTVSKSSYSYTTAVPWMARGQGRYLLSRVNIRLRKWFAKSGWIILATFQFSQK